MSANEPVETYWCETCQRWLRIDRGCANDDDLLTAGGHEWDEYTCPCRCEDHIETTTCPGPVYPRAEALRRGLGRWSSAFPPKDMADGATYLMRGHDDPPEDAIRVRLVLVHRTASELATSVLRPLRWSNLYDVEDGGGNPNVFERRPLHEMEGALWKYEGNRRP